MSGAGPICSRGRSAQQHGLGGVAGVGAMGGVGGGDTIGGGGVVAPDPRAYIPRAELGSIRFSKL